MNPISPKKTVVILGPAHPLRGGLAAFNERLARELIHQGHSVIIYTFSLQYPSFLFPGKTQYSDSPKPNDLEIKVEVNSINPLNWIQIGKKIKSLKPDVLMIRFWLPFMGPSLGTIAKIVKGNKHTTIISVLDNVIPHEHRIADKLFTKFFLNKVDRFIAMSEQVLNDLRTFTNKPCQLILHPIYDHYGEVISKEKACAHLKIESSLNYILFFGFIRNYKGLDLLLKAMTDVRIRERKIKLIIAGEFYEDSTNYLQFIKENNLESSIVLATDYIPDDEVKYYFSVADLIVQPYKSATQSGISQIAYHFEKPMVVTKVGGLPEMVPNGKAGYVVEVDALSIADAIIDFYENNRSKNLVEGLVEEKKKYSWETFANAITS